MHVLVEFNILAMEGSYMFLKIINVFLWENVVCIES
jgi:hypothetical protein